MRQELAEPEHGTRGEVEDTVRRCALTRERLPKQDLIRFVLSPNGEIVPDLKERLPGRGVWVTAAHDKVAEAAKRNVFARALKTKVTVPADLPERVERLIVEAALGALALANKAGSVVFGTAKVEEAIAKGRTAALIHASAPRRTGAASSTAGFARALRRKRPLRRSAYLPRMNWVWHRAGQM